MKRVAISLSLLFSVCMNMLFIPSASTEEKKSSSKDVIHLAFLVDDVWLECQEGEMLSSVIRGVRMRAPSKLSFRLHFRRDVAGKSLDWWSRWGRGDRGEGNNTLVAQKPRAFLVGIEIRSGLPVEYRFATAKKGWSKWKENRPWSMLPAREQKQEDALIGIEFRYLKKRYPHDPLPPKQFRKALQGQRQGQGQGTVPTMTKPLSPSRPIIPSIPSLPIVPSSPAKP